MRNNRRLALSIVVLLFFAPVMMHADDITTQGWIDGPFFDLLGRFGDLYASYTATAYSIGRILLMLDLGLMAIMWALNGGEVQKELNKRLLTIFIITAMMMWYPSIMTGVMKFAQNVGLVPVKSALADAQATMQAKADALLRDYYEKVARGDKSAKVPGNYKTLAANAKANIAFTGTFTFKGANGKPIQAEFIRPDGIMKYTMIIATPLYAASFKGNLLTNAAQVLLCVIALLAMMICAAIVVLQYIMAMVEYQILVGVGILLVPFALFDKTRFITEKFVGAIFGHLMKIVLIIVIIGVFSGAFVSLAKMNFTGSLDQIVKYVFTMLLYAILGVKRSRNCHGNPLRISFPHRRHGAEHRAYCDAGDSNRGGGRGCGQVSHRGSHAGRLPGAVTGNRGSVGSRGCGFRSTRECVEQRDAGRGWVFPQRR